MFNVSNSRHPAVVTPSQPNTYTQTMKKILASLLVATGLFAAGCSSTSGCGGTCAKGEKSCCGSAKCAGDKCDKAACCAADAKK